MGSSGDTFCVKLRFGSQDLFELRISLRFPTAQVCPKKKEKEKKKEKKKKEKKSSPGLPQKSPSYIPYRRLISSVLGPNNYFLFEPTIRRGFKIVLDNSAKEHSSAKSNHCRPLPS
jgi:hypothetical protein